ncbi:TIGR03749 family integrating conjugative element protein, partial [Salmonella enterica]|nr:TIGR03749 family integrating conjugative element protein [Salmonella enterica]EJA5857988.1 TIGR03749 family integrating conjugative element protein [Salmonella enterica]EJU3354873.1 TIGR03749 family integrating conjugative element protein [Salmonella enterica]EJX4305153.1 TIGR03749 family integrating conjugative element protein [Salmonella enterica]EJX4360690.1 TIGR03749 family integrating conjugative element protein [Salmonella enterica]
AAAPASRQDAKLNGPLPVVLTRYAAQTLYAPLRTVEALPGIHPLPLRLPAHITTLYPSEPLDIRPLAAWGRGEYSVVALRVRNTGNGKVVTDPRVLAGRFVAATFQHRWLGPAGQPEDTTTLYLVMQGRPEAAFIAEPPITVKKGGKR